MKHLGGADQIIQSDATAINNNNVIVGWWNTTTSTSPRKAAVWSGPQYQVSFLNSLGGPSSYATAINDSGVVVGNSQISSTVYHAVRWNNVVPTDLGTLGGSNSYATAINASGVIVGQSQLAGNVTSHAVIWEDDVAVDLNNSIDAASANAGWILERANDINDLGWIVGTARNTLSGESHAFRLEPVDMPNLEGDFDMDGDVDGQDFLLWQRGGSPSGPTAGDLAEWQRDYGIGVFTASSNAVPEPSGIILLLACCILVNRRRQHLWQCSH